MRIVGLVASPEHVCSRYRLQAFAAGLASSGHELRLAALPRGLHAWRLGRLVRGTDVVVLQRRLLPGWQLALLRRAASRLVFDFDDAVFLRDSYHPRVGPCPRRVRRFAAVMQYADAVHAGNEWLADRAVTAGARNVIGMPTCIDPTIYPTADHERPGGPLTLVWLGSRSTLQGLERARPLLEHLGQSMPGLRLRLVCDAFLDFQHLPVERVPWSPAAEVTALQTADVGVSLLPDDDWSRGKCGLKVLQYMAAGLPVVGNPVGVTADLLRPGTSEAAGMCATEPAEWVAALRQLHDPALRRTLGATGRRRVERDFSVTSGLIRWLAFLNEPSVLRRAG